MSSSLFNKYLKILNNTPPYNEYIEILGDTLINITKEGYKEKYFDIDFLLTLIETLSSTALILLTKSDDWQNETYIKTGKFELLDNLVLGDCYTDFAKHYQDILLKDGTSNNSSLITMHSRIGIVMRELSNEGLIMAYGEGNPSKKEFKISLTKTAIEILELLKVR